MAICRNSASRSAAGILPTQRGHHEPWKTLSGLIEKRWPFWQANSSGVELFLYSPPSHLPRRCSTISIILWHWLSRVLAALPREMRGPQQLGCGHQLPLRTLEGTARHLWPKSQQNNIFLASSLSFPLGRLPLFFDTTSLRREYVSSGRGLGFGLDRATITSKYF